MQCLKIIEERLIFKPQNGFCLFNAPLLMNTFNITSGHWTLQAVIMFWNETFQVIFHTLCSAPNFSYLDMYLLKGYLASYKTKGKGFWEMLFSDKTFLVLFVEEIRSHSKRFETSIHWFFTLAQFLTSLCAFFQSSFQYSFRHFHAYLSVSRANRAILI